MTWADFDSIIPCLTVLEAKAKRLNETSDEANRVLSTIESRLLNLNIGLEIWHPKPLASSDYEAGVHDTRSRVIQQMGYARVDGKWCLALKPVRIVTGFFQGDENCPYEDRFADGVATPLLKQSRSLRIAAMREMPQFVITLSEHIDATIRDLEEATQQLT